MMFNNLKTERIASGTYTLSYTFNGIHNQLNSLSYDNMMELSRMIISAQIGFKVDPKIIIKYRKDK